MFASPNQTFTFPSCRFPDFSNPPYVATTSEYGPPLRFNENQEDYAPFPWENHGYVIVPSNDSELPSRRIVLKYSAAQDAYERSSGGGGRSTRIEGWKQLAFRSLNVARKQEDDWKMAYLARTERFDSHKVFGVLEWKFNLGCAGMKVKDLQIRVPFTLYRDGNIRVSVSCRDDYTILHAPNRLCSVVRAIGWNEFVLRVEITGENADRQYSNAYQNAQIFRQRIEDNLNNEGQPAPGPIDSPAGLLVIVEMEPIAQSGLSH